MRKNAFKCVIVFTTVMMFFGLLTAQTTYFVSNQGDDSNNGLSWATAKATINGAMALITSPNNDSVFVAVGTYPACTIKSSTHVYGGFTGTESHLYERQPLSYGIASDSSCSVIDAQHNSNYAVSINGYMYYNNAYNCRSVDFDGFYVTGGNQYGVYSEANNTYTISNCTMTGNACGLYLGISYSNSYYSSTYQVSNCKINGNTTNGGVQMYNGSQTYGGTFEFDNCMIAENTGSQFGGMRFNTYAYTTTNHIIVNNCDVVKNIASGLNAKAGGILTQNNDFDYAKTRCEWRILNSRIIDNTVYTIATTASADDSWPYIAGGISVYTHTTHILGCVISNNSAISTEGIDVTGGVASYANGTSTSSSNTGDPVGRLYMTNCVVANNLAQTTNSLGTGGIRTVKAATIKNTVMWNNKCGSTVSNCRWSTSYALPYTYCASETSPTSDFATDSTNIVLDSLTQPLFVAPSSMVGATTIATDLSNLAANWHVQPISPLVDAGDPNTAFITYLPATDMDGNPRIYNIIADIGAYECTQTTMNQAIIWNQTLSATLGDAPVLLTATATSGLPVSYSSSDTSIAYVHNDSLYFVGVGAALITASQAGNTLYQPAADVSLIVNVSAPVLYQSITWNQTLTTCIDSGTLVLNAIASSGLPVSYTCSDESIAVVNGNTLTLMGVGQAVITASQAGNAYYHPAQNVVKILTVTENGGTDDPQPQTIVWNQDLNVSLNEQYLPLTATATSGLPVSYTCNDETVATVYGSILILHAPGLAIITASQPGNDQYMAAPNVMKILQVTDPTGIPDHAVNSVNVWPNPTTSIVNVQCTMNNVQAGTMEIRVYDAFGRLLRTTDVVETFHGTSLPTDENGSSMQIDLSSFAPGVYFIKAVADGNVMGVRKVVKQ
ncbi:MAG: T9SS type A sorting domain-containing protein [Bacteroidales bacterium]|nr:T9SS type A sorting domain-containing protein [Bacteroidales bacterium]